MASMNTCTYNGISWKPTPTPTKVDDDNFFHAVFGKRTTVDGELFDKHVQFRRKNLNTYLTYFQNEYMPSCLVKILNKCFSENDKYNGLSFENQLAKYISATVDQSITINDIPILATLENIKIVIFSTKAKSPTIITPKKDLLLGYPNGSMKPKEKVVLFLNRGIFSRMEEHVNKNLSQPAKNNTKLKKNGYRKGGTSGIKGIHYQIKLLVIFLLNAFLNLKKWELSTEIVEADKFDDVVIESPKGAILLQSKFRENKKKKITLGELLSDDSKKDDFSPPKYFLSYQKVKNNFKVRDIIICTNANVHGNIKQYLTPENVQSTNMLHYASSQIQFYKFNKLFLPILKDKLKDYYDKNCSNKGNKDSVITDKNLEEFLQHLQFYCNYPSQKDTLEVIQELLFSNQLQSKVSPNEIIFKVINWYEEKNADPLDYIRAKAKFCEISRDRYYQSLLRYDVLFQNDDWYNRNSKQIFHVVAETDHLLQELKIYNDLQNNKNKTLYVNRSDSIDIQKEVVRAFDKIQYYVFLVIIWSSATEDSVVSGICHQLKDILKKKYKKVVLVAEENILSRQSQLVIGDCERITEYEIFRTLLNDTKKKLLRQESIIFQGRKVNLNKLFSPKKVEDCLGAVILETLQKLANQEEIKVGTSVLDLDNRTEKCYVTRRFKREIKKNQDGFNDIKETELLPQSRIYDQNEKVILITSGSGEGKTTVLTKIAADLKKKYSDLWVIKIELRDYASIFKKCTTEGKPIDIKKLLNFKDNSLEESVFSVREKVIMLLDGIDEVSHYTALITDLLIQCKNSPNIAKIFAASKPHVTLELEKELGIKPFELQPFTQRNQVYFLEQYLAYNSKLDMNVRKCSTTFIEMVSKTNSNDNSGNQFAAVPLQAMIAAEQFQKWIELNGDKCTSYSNGDTDTLDFPEVSFTAKLFEALIETKRSNYINKLDPSGNPHISRSLTEQFNKCLTYDEHIALQVTLDERKRMLLSHCLQNDEDMQILSSTIGILPKSGFNCGRFVEYLVARHLTTKLKVNQDHNLQKFFQEDVLMKPEFKIIRGFLNYLLQREDYLVFQEGIFLTQKQTSMLKKEGCQKLLDLISTGRRT